jgi:hypothetical protein
MEKISWTDRVRNEVLQGVKDERSNLKTVRRKTKCNAHILRKNCLLKRVIERKMKGRVEMTGRQGRIHKQLLNDLKETTDCWKLKEETVARTLWRTDCGGSYGTVVR